MSETTLEKSTLQNTDNQIEISTVFQITIVNSNTKIDRIIDD